MVNIQELVKISKRFTLLFVEDDHNVRQSMLLFLETFFDDIIVAKSGHEGLRKFSENQIDIVITDITMPDMDGLRMVEAMRRQDARVPVLIVTAYNDTGYLRESIRLRVDGYITKPLDSKEFTQTLWSVISRIRLEERAKKSECLLRQYQKTIDIAAIVSKTDLKGNITYVNDNFCSISGYSASELLGANHNIVRHPDVPKSFYRRMWQRIRDEKQIWHGIIRNKTKSGKSYYVKSTIAPILDTEGNIVEYFAVRNEITDVMNPKKQLDDALANLKVPLVVYLKLEDFVTLEEFFGNEEIEQIQTDIARHLETYMPAVCGFEKVYVLGNGEYAMIQELHKCTRPPEFLSEDLRRFQEEVKKNPIDIFGIRYEISFMMSVVYEGKSVLESAKLGIKELVKRKQDFIIANHFARIRKDKAARNMEILLMVKEAIANDKIVSWFQPIVDNKTRRVVKYESLVRLINRNEEVLSPFYFLQTAQKGEYYAQITRKVVENSFDALTRTEHTISLNLSVLDIEQSAFRSFFYTMLERHKEHASRLVIELLEDQNIKKFKLIRHFIQRIKQYGVRIAIDDFGSGYSNFERLIDYQPDILKIDGALIRNIVDDPYALSVVKTIVTFAKEQGIELIAEFVENEEIYRIVTDLGVEYSQGYYFGEPRPLFYARAADVYSTHEIGQRSK